MLTRYHMNKLLNPLNKLLNPFFLNNSAAYLNKHHGQNWLDLKRGKVEHHFSPWTQHGTVDQYGVTEIIRPNPTNPKVSKGIHFAAYNIWPSIYDRSGGQPNIIFMTTGDPELQYIVLPGKGWYTQPSTKYRHLGPLEQVYENRAEQLNRLKVCDYIAASDYPYVQPYIQRRVLRWDCDYSSRGHNSVHYSDLFGFEKYLNPDIYAVIGRRGIPLYNLFTINNEKLRKRRLQVFSENPRIVDYFVSGYTFERIKASWLLEKIDHPDLGEKEIRHAIDTQYPPLKDGKNKLRIS